MKINNLKLTLSFCALMFSQIANLTAGYPVYPPTSRVGVDGLVFADSDNESMLRSCDSRATVCARFYVLPKFVSVKRNEETGAKMVSHGIIAGPGGRLKALSIYNLTLQPVFASGRSGDKDPLSGIRAIQDKAITQLIPSFMKQREIPAVEVLANQIEIAPLPIADTQFILTGLAGEFDSLGASVKASQGPPPIDPQTNAPQLDEEEIDTKVQSIANGVRYTRFFAPKWQGDTHSLGQPFSISVQGNAWNVEPAFKRMMTATSGNAVIGTMSFRFRALARPIKMKVSCNLQTFHQVVNSTQKKWHHYRYKSLFKSVERFSNEEWNAIRSSLKISDFCNVVDFKDTTLPADQAMKEVEELLFNSILKRAFKTYDQAGTPIPPEGKDPRYTFFESSATVEASAVIDLEFNQDRVLWFSSDLDFQGGAISEDQLDPSHWALCEHWSRANPATKKCQEICEPWSQVYWRDHPKATLPPEVNFPVPACVKYEDL